MAVGESFEVEATSDVPVARLRNAGGLVTCSHPPSPDQASDILPTNRKRNSNIKCYDLSAPTLPISSWESHHMETSLDLANEEM